VNNPPSCNIGIVGATGAVGQELLKLIFARSFPYASLRLFASARSAGKIIEIEGKKFPVAEARPEIFEDLDVAFFAVDGALARSLAPHAVKAGCLVLDKSSAFRLQPDVPLVVPNINFHAVRQHKGIIASPNCSTAVAMMGLFPLHRAFGLKRYFVATYQSVSGTGVEAVAELDAQVRAYGRGEPMTKQVYPYQIAFNIIPQVDTFNADGYTGEEAKMLAESRKILELPVLKVSATCVRVPVVRAHSAAINAEFERPVSVAAAHAAIAGFDGAQLVDDPAKNAYPTPLDFSEKEKCGVGRVRLDSALDNGLAFWVSGDNLWRGAALNSLQIAERMLQEGLLRSKAALGASA
jgi:aspartate-semialdehyde dehydrogenase